MLTDPFDYAAEDALIDSWAAARASVVVPELAVRARVRARLQRPVRATPHARGVRGMTSGPMEGVRVLDLSIALTGPYAAALLADQGAEVVKVERPGIGDIARWVGVSVNGMSSLYLVCNRGKRSIAVDVQQPAGAEIVRRLAARADVRDPELPARRARPPRPRLRRRRARVNPDVVYASLSGFGREGPYRDRSAYDTVIQAYGGFAANQADPRRRRPRLPPPDRGRQGDRPVRQPGHHRRAVRARSGAGAASTSSCR